MSEGNKSVELDALPEEELLKMKICQLAIRLEGTWIEECVQDLYKELEMKGLFFRPACYLADEWLTPENETCIGIPFYLAHPALIRLERKFMIEAEGESRTACLQLLRHEAGHAICYAYKLNKRRKWKEIFGPSSISYRDTYRFQPYSKSYVRHLDGYYAQHHPDEDFSETFAVWLTPDSNWQNQYKGWKALHKLRYVDALMTEIWGEQPLVKSGRKFWRLSTLKLSLETYYKKKRRNLAEAFEDFHDPFLEKNFSPPGDESQKNKVSASKVISRYKRSILNNVSYYCGEKKYIINDILKSLQKRSHELKLVAFFDEVHTALSLSTYITSLIMNYHYTGHFRGNSKRPRKHEEKT